MLKDLVVLKVVRVQRALLALLVRHPLVVVETKDLKVELAVKVDKVVRVLKVLRVLLAPRVPHQPDQVVTKVQGVLKDQSVELQVLAQ